MDKLKSPSLVLLIVGLLYSGIVGFDSHNVSAVLGLCVLYALELGTDALKLYLDANRKPEKEPTELEKLTEQIKIEEAQERLAKAKKRERETIGFSDGTVRKFEF